MISIPPRPRRLSPKAKSGRQFPKQVFSANLVDPFAAPCFQLFIVLRVALLGEFVDLRLDLFQRRFELLELLVDLRVSARKAARAMQVSTFRNIQRLYSSTSARRGAGEFHYLWSSGKGGMPIADSHVGTGR